MENASYHSRLINKTSTSCSEKCDVIEWLTFNNTDHDPVHTKSELLQLVASHKNTKEYEIDKIVYEHGHKVVRIPPYHWHLNPTERIWAQIKSAIRKENLNSNQTLNGVEELPRWKVNSMSKEDWRKYMDHTRDVEKEYRTEGTELLNTCTKIFLSI